MKGEFTFTVLRVNLPIFVWWSRIWKPMSVWPHLPFISKITELILIKFVIEFYNNICG